MAELASELAVAGAVGINLEDRLGPADLHAAKIAAVKAAIPVLLVTPTPTPSWRGDGVDEQEAVRRLDACRQAGADGVFVPGLTDPARVTALLKTLDVPLNILYSPAGPSVSRLASLGVRRISLGSYLYRRALGAALDAMADIRSGRPPRGTAPTCATRYRPSARRTGPPGGGRPASGFAGNAV